MRSDPNQPVSQPDQFGQPASSAGSSANYVERLSPSTGIWALAIAFGTGLGLVPAPVSVTAAVIVAISGLVAVITLMIVMTPRLEVTQDRFIAGKAQVPLTLVDTVEPLTGPEMRRALGVGLDARAYLCTRAWLPAGAKITLRDPEDPTPYWLVSSRRPEALAAAVSSRIARADQRD
jgi:hypothetical protein